MAASSEFRLHLSSSDSEGSAVERVSCRTRSKKSVDVADKIKEVKGPKIAPRRRQSKKKKKTFVVDSDDEDDSDFEVKRVKKPKGKPEGNRPVEAVRRCFSFIPLGKPIGARTRNCEADSTVNFIEATPNVALPESSNVKPTVTAKAKSKRKKKVVDSEDSDVEIIGEIIVTKVTETTNLGTSLGEIDEVDDEETEVFSDDLPDIDSSNESGDEDRDGVSQLKIACVQGGAEGIWSS